MSRYIYTLVANLYCYRCKDRKMLYSDAGTPMRIDEKYERECLEPHYYCFHCDSLATVVTVEEIRAKLENNTFEEREEDPEYNVEHLFADAAEFVRRKGYATSDLLVKKFKIGYIQSARLMDLLEKKKVIFPGYSGEKRKVRPQKK